jgi:hypothetical protein
MKKLILMTITIFAIAIFAGCSEQGTKTLEATYKVGEIGVKTFVPQDTRDKLGLKEKNEFVKENWQELKSLTLEAKE